MEQINHNQVGQQYNIKLSVNGIQVPTKNILSSVLREWIFDHVVTLECSILDSGTFVELSPIFDESPVTIEFSKNNDVDTVKMDFAINAWETERVNVDNGAVYGIRFIALQKTTDYFYPIHTRVFKNSTTSEVLQSICQESGLEFVKDVDANDSQMWMQSNQCNHVFTHHLMKRSYVNPEDLPVFYFNRHNQAVFSTIKIKAAKKAKFLAINNDMAFMDNGNDLVLKQLKESYGTDSIIFYRTDFKTKNISPIMNKYNGYGIDFTYFDHRNFFEYQLNFVFNPFSKYQNVNKKNAGKFTNGWTFNGLSKNVHENYILGKVQNLYLSEVFYGNYLQIYVNPNMKLNVGDKIEMLIYDNLGKILNGSPSVDVVNSGEYLVGGISHDIKKDGLYTMIVTLFRNGTNESSIKPIQFESITK
jgi:hypothetical protein